MNHTNALDTSAPFYLVIGRKRQLVSKPARFETRNEFREMRLKNEDLTPSMVVPVSQTYQLFIDSKLFATVKAVPKRRYSRAPVRIVKPDGGPIEIHLVKKYMVFH